MVSIPIENETPYTLTDAMRQDILRDAHEHFGNEVHSVLVQDGLERHAFNARTHEVRYAFSPNDFGLVDTTTTFPDTYYSPVDIPSIDDDTEEETVPEVFDEVEVDDEDRRETSLESLEEEIEDDEDEEDDFRDLDDQFEDVEEEDSFTYDDDDYD